MQVYPLVVPGGQPSMLLLCTDWGITDVARDAVMPIGIDSLQLALALPPDALRGRRVLDVCAGSGIHGLVAAAHGAAHVLLSDLSARAARFCAFNRALNGFDGARVAVAAPGDGYSRAVRAAACETWCSGLRCSRYLNRRLRGSLLPNTPSPRPSQSPSAPSWYCRFL